MYMLFWVSTSECTKAIGSTWQLAFSEGRVSSGSLSTDFFNRLLISSYKLKLATCLVDSHLAQQAEG